VFFVVAVILHDEIKITILQLHAKLSDKLVERSSLKAVELTSLRQCSRKRVQQLKNVRSRVFRFPKKLKNVCTLFETNLTEQSLIVQINNIYSRVRQWLGSRSGSWENGN